MKIIYPRIADLKVGDACGQEAVRVAGGYVLTRDIEICDTYTSMALFCSIKIGDQFIQNDTLFTKMSTNTALPLGNTNTHHYHLNEKVIPVKEIVCYTTGTAQNT